MDRTAESLDLDSVRNLRLTNTRLRDQMDNSCFRSFISSQKTDLTSRSLKRLSEIANHPKLGSAVQSFVVIAVVHDTSELDRMIKTKRRRIFEKQGVFSMTTEPQATEDELAEAQRNREKLLTSMREQESRAHDESDVRDLAVALRFLGKLDTLAVQAAVDQGLGGYIASASAREWHPIWIRASQVYLTVMQAIANSGIGINALRIFSTSRRCSVPTWDINESMSTLLSANFDQAAKHIKGFALSVSTKVETDPQKIADARANLSDVDRAYYEAGMPTRIGLLSADDPLAIADENYPGVARLLQQMPNLERLDLHLYQTLQGHPRSYAKVFTHIAEKALLESLKNCTFRGLYCDESSLLAFFCRRDSLITLEMRDMHLVSGSWAPVFARLCTLPDLQQVVLHNIWSPKGLVHLAPKQPPQKSDDDVPSWSVSNTSSFPCLDGRMVYSRTFSRDEMINERFEFAKGPEERQMGSPAFYVWMTSKQAEYGPP